MKKADWWCDECSQAMCGECLKRHNDKFDTLELDETTELRDDFEQFEGYQGDFEGVHDDNAERAHSSFHTISSLVGALENKRSTIWHVQHRCRVHGMMSLGFCLQCKLMKCDDCLADCTREEHKTCTAKDEQAVVFSEAYFNRARDALDYLEDVSAQQQDVMDLRLIKARKDILDSLERKRKVMLDAIRKAYTDAVSRLDNHIHAIIRSDLSSATLHATSVKQAVLYGKLLLEHSHINASRRQWQMLMPRIETLTDTENQLLQTYMNATIPVIEERLSTSKLDEVCQEWFGDSVQPTDYDIPPSEKDEEREQEAAPIPRSNNGQLNIVTTESLASDNGAPAGELSPSEITRLIPIVTSEMNKISDKCGQFAYYFGKNMELEAYVTSDTKCNVDALQEVLVAFLRSHISEQYVHVTVKQDAPIALFCCGGVGSLLTVGRMEQVIGLYVQYQAKGTIYWVSAAHGLAKCSPESRHADGPVHFLEAATTTSFMHVSNKPKITARFSACPDLDMVDIPVPYIALSYNPTVLRRLNGDKLCHSVDIMMGPTPLTNWHVSNYIPCKSSLTSAIDGCCPPFCWARHHTRGLPLYTISSIRYFEPLSHNGCTTFEMGSVVGKNLSCYLGDGRQLATGCVQSVYNCTPTTMHSRTPTTLNDRADASVYLAQNMLCITPTGSCRPAEGHSGSVWVRQCSSSGGCEAVAITCAVILPREQNSALGSDRYEAWLAAPLCACLLALSEQYPERFGDYKEFTVLN